MPNLKLTYFDFPGGRGDTARLIFAAGKVKYEDHRISGQDFAPMKPELPFGSLPVLHVDGEPVAQSVAIFRYAGRLGGLYPSKDPDALHCDEVLEAVEDLTARIGATLGIKDPAQLKSARDALAAGPVPTFMKGFEHILKRRGPDYFVSNKLSVADIAVFCITKWLKSGVLDHLPKDLVEKTAPAVNAHFTRMKSHDFVKQHFAARNVSLPE
jgi:glutathione S-transferase